MTTEPIQRYDLNGDASMDQHPHGDYVRHADVEPILRNWPAVLVALSQCRDVLKLALDASEIPYLGASGAALDECSDKIQQAHKTALLALAGVNQP